METINEINLSAMSGEATYRIPQRLELNEVTLNGDGDVDEVKPGEFKRKGGFFRKRILVGRTNKDEKPEEVNLGHTVRLVFLKVRRRLVEKGEKGKTLLSTNEHNTKADTVTLYDSRTKSVVGNAAALRERHEGLRTVQIVYALLLGPNEPELMRLTVRGASLGSEAKAETTKDFYDYISSFGKGEHWWEYETVLGPVLETGLKAYFAIDFKRGPKLSPDMAELAVERLKEVHAKCVELDEARAAKVTVAVPAKTGDEVIDGLVEAAAEDQTLPEDGDPLAAIHF